ncbi:MAG: glycoside hydrolase family 15 protein [Pyrinomonadaceae bacterium MAG19_C2-C3]|nr:glycoside hydrolase family 15 protein [Pyrinomonadaceae bacterium MAG19_C2-C3]
MPRDIPVGNGRFLVTFDDAYRIRDIYFPHVGRENHTEGHPCRFGVWVDGRFSWVSDGGWRRELKYLPDTLVTDVRLSNETLALEIVSNDTIDFHENIFVRRLRVRNLSNHAREVRLFFHHDFYISESEVGDTAFFDPDLKAFVHYKGARYFLISTDAPEGVETFATGRKAFHGAEGTWRDAEDGTLSNSAIMEGSVDSTIGRVLHIPAHDEVETFYWIAAGESYTEVATLNKLIHDRTPDSLINRTEAYWRAWSNKNDIAFANLPETVIDAFRRSLLIIRTQTDHDGAILAANDSDVTLRATDHYSYVWQRDGALVAFALDAAGYSSMTRSFFDFCRRTIEAEGYFLQKYNPDGTPASSWHARWDARTREKLAPIQQDETALVVWALWHHYDNFRDIEFVASLYRPLIIRAADFLVRFRDEATGLPLPSWNLWEDRRGIHTFTVASVIGALTAAAKFANLFGDTDHARTYLEIADTMRDALRTHIYDDEHQRFARALMPDGNGGFYKDMTIDASLFGIFYFGAFAVDDALVRTTMRAVENRLWVKTEIGGVARYEADGYMSVTNDTEHVPGNPWFICTLWLADYRTARAQNLEELNGTLQLLGWATERALPSGAFAEQIHPLSGAPLSVSPLTWSHSTFVATVMGYLRKRESLVAGDS